MILTHFYKNMTIFMLIDLFKLSNFEINDFATCYCATFPRSLPVAK